MPERRCISCRTTRPQHELVRYWRRSDGAIVRCDASLATGSRGGARVGRGAYICPTQACARASWRQGRWARAFRAKVLPCPDVDVFWLELARVLVKAPRFLYRSSLDTKGQAGPTARVSP